MSPTEDQIAAAAKLASLSDELAPRYLILRDSGKATEWQPWADTEAGRSDALVLLAAVMNYSENNPLCEEVCDAHADLVNSLCSGNVQQIQEATFAAAVAIGEHMLEDSSKQNYRK